MLTTAYCLYCDSFQFRNVKHVYQREYSLIYSKLYLEIHFLISSWMVRDYLCRKIARRVEGQMQGTSKRTGNNEKLKLKLIQEER